MEKIRGDQHTVDVAIKQHSRSQLLVLVTGWFVEWETKKTPAPFPSCFCSMFSVTTSTTSPPFMLSLEEVGFWGLTTKEADYAYKHRGQKLKHWP
jgi:hypothetical protein